MIKKALSIFKFLIAFIVAIVILVNVFIEIFLPKKVAGFGFSIDLISIAILVAASSVYVFYLVRTAIWDWKNKAYRFNILLIIALMIQYFMGGMILFRQDYQTRDAYFWVQVCFALIFWSISVYDTIRVFKGLRRKLSRKDEALLAELFQEP